MFPSETVTYAQLSKNVHFPYSLKLNTYAGKIKNAYIVKII